MKPLLKSDFQFEYPAELRKDRTRGLPSGWWLLPSVALGLAGWIGIFHLFGLL